MKNKNYITYLLLLIISLFTIALIFLHSEFSSSEEFTDDDIDNNHISKNAKHNNSTSSDDIASTITVESGVASPSTSAGSSFVNDRYILETILRKLEHVINTQNQQSLVLNNILSSNQAASSLSLNKPADIPSLPVNSKPEYKALEEFLKNEEKYNYMVS